VSGAGGRAEGKGISCRLAGGVEVVDRRAVVFILAGVAGFFTTLESPLGELRLTSDGLGLTGLVMGGEREGMGAGGQRNDAFFGEAVGQLRAYFAGELRVFDVPLAAGGTDFQRRVWAALREIPFGQTCSYAELARRIGRPGASRAVGQANRLNPIPVIVPCHRVIGIRGMAIGYSGGLVRQRWLLGHEGRPA